MDVQTEVKTEKLWKNYWEKPTPDNKNEIVVAYLDLVNKVVRRMYPSATNKSGYDDLISSGVMGLIDAVDKYDKSRGIPFEAYAQTRIRGDVLDYMRRQDWISTSLRRRIKQINEIKEDLYLNLGRDPTKEEIAAKGQCTVKQVEKAESDEYTYSLVCFEKLAMEGEDSYSVIDFMADDRTEVNPEKKVDKDVMLQLLSGAIDKLPEKEQLVLNLYYRDGLYLRDIAEILGVNESRVSQLHSKAIVTLKKQLDKDISG